MRGFFQTDFGFVALLPQRVALVSENRMLRCQHRDSRLAFEQRIGCRFAAPAENDALGRNEFSGESRGGYFAIFRSGCETLFEILENCDVVKQLRD